MEQFLEIETLAIELLLVASLVAIASASPTPSHWSSSGCS